MSRHARVPTAVNPRTIVSVLESSPATQDAALTQALVLARSYGSDLHVVDFEPWRGRDDHCSAVRHAAADARIARAAQAAGADGVTVTQATLSGARVRAIAAYAWRVGAELVVAGTEPRRHDGFWSAGAFGAALGAAASAPTLTIASDAPPAEAVTRLRTVVAAVDFSETSRRGLSAAVALARDNGARLKVLHVLEYAFDFTYAGAWALAVLDEADARAEAVAAELRSWLPADTVDRVDIAVTPASATPADAIVRTAAEGGADLIVLGLPRRRSLDALMAGSTAHKVVRRASCPVLLVPGAAPARVPRAVALDRLVPVSVRVGVLTN